jgi:hypothetical protein
MVGSVLERPSSRADWTFGSVLRAMLTAKSALAVVVLQRM